MENQKAAFALQEELNPKQLLTMEEVMLWLKVKDKRTILKYVEQGLPAIKLGYKSYRFTKSEVEEFLNRRKIQR